MSQRAKSGDYGGLGMVKKNLVISVPKLHFQNIRENDIAWIDWYVNVLYIFLNSDCTTFWNYFFHRFSDFFASWRIWSFKTFIVINIFSAFFKALVPIINNFFQTKY